MHPYSCYYKSGGLIYVVTHSGKIQANNFPLRISLRSSADLRRMMDVFITARQSEKTEMSF